MLPRVSTHLHHAMVGWHRRELELLTPTISLGVGRSRQGLLLLGVALSRQP